MLIHIAKHHAALDPVEDQPDVTAGTGRPEVLVSDVVEPVALDAWVGRIDLQLEGGELGGLPLFSSKPIKATLERIGEEKIHRQTKATKRALPFFLMQGGPSPKSQHFELPCEDPP